IKIATADDQSDLWLFAQINDKNKDLTHRHFQEVTPLRGESRHKIPPQHFAECGYNGRLLQATPLSMTFHSLVQPPLSNSPGNRQHWGQLHGSAQPLAIATAALAHPGLSLVITTDTSSALRLETELAFFCSNRLPVLHLADWETLPYDTISPHQDIISERLSTLYRLPNCQQALLVVPVTSLLQRLMPQSYLIGNSLMLSKGETLKLDQMRLNLEKAGYHCVDTVYEHGEFAVRGALLDIFPMGSDLPYRIDLFDDEIETLRTFDPETQLTLEQ